MADQTHIEWTDATWNPVTGCSLDSPGCTNCYAMKLAGTRLKHHPSRKGLTVDSKAGPVWNGEVRLNREWLHQPLEWTRPRMIFVCAHGDLFHESVPDDWILDVFTVMAAAPQHTFQILTKRASRMHDFVNREELLDDIYANWSTFSGGPREVWSWPLHNVWLGCSAENQVWYDRRRRWLDETPAAVKFWSLEPLLGSIDMNIRFVKPDWVIVGGESGHGARPMHPDWARSIRDQCAEAGVPIFFKQWGEWETALDRDRDDPGWRADYKTDYVDSGKSRWLNLAGGQGFHGERFHVMRRVGKKAAGRLLDGVLHDGYPEVRHV